MPSESPRCRPSRQRCQIKPPPPARSTKPPRERSRDVTLAVATHSPRSKPARPVLPPSIRSTRTRPREPPRVATTTTVVSPAPRCQPAARRRQIARRARPPRKWILRPGADCDAVVARQGCPGSRMPTRERDASVVTAAHRCGERTPAGRLPSADVRIVAGSPMEVFARPSSRPPLPVGSYRGRCPVPARIPTGWSCASAGRPALRSSPGRVIRSDRRERALSADLWVLTPMRIPQAIKDAYSFGPPEARLYRSHDHAGGQYRARTPPSPVIRSLPGGPGLRLWPDSRIVGELQPGSLVVTAEHPAGRRGDRARRARAGPARGALLRRTMSASAWRSRNLMAWTVARGALLIGGPAAPGPERPPAIRQSP